MLCCCLDQQVLFTRKDIKVMWLSNLLTEVYSRNACALCQKCTFLSCTIISNLRFQTINFLTDVVVAFHVKVHNLVAKPIRQVFYAVNVYVYIVDIFIVEWNAAGFPQFPGYSPVSANKIVGYRNLRNDHVIKIELINMLNINIECNTYLYCNISAIEENKNKYLFIL